MNSFSYICYHWTELLISLLTAGAEHRCFKYAAKRPKAAEVPNNCAQPFLRVYCIRINKPKTLKAIPPLSDYRTPTMSYTMLLLPPVKKLPLTIQVRPLRRRPRSCACNSRISFKLSSSASITEFVLLFLLCEPAPALTLIVGELLSLVKAPPELLLGRRIGPDSGVYLGPWCFAGCDDCLEEADVVGGVKPFSFRGAGGVCCSVSAWVESGGDTKEDATVGTICISSPRGSHLTSDSGDVAIRLTSSSGQKTGG